MDRRTVMPTKRQASFRYIITMVALLIIMLTLGCFNSETYANSSNYEISFDNNFITPSERLEDLEHLDHIISNHYPFFWIKNRLGYTDWTDNEGYYRKLIFEANTPYKFHSAIKSILNGLHNWHSHIIPHALIEDYVLNFGLVEWEMILTKAMPARFFWDEIARETWAEESYLVSHYFDGSYYMAYAATLENGIHIPYGSRILSIGGMSPETFIENYRDELYIVRDSASDDTFAFNLFESISGDKPIAIELDDPRMTIKVTNNDIIDMDGCFHNRRFGDSNVITTSLLPGKVSYIKVSSFDHMLLEGDIKTLETFFNNHASDEAIIIDIRSNAGGSTNYWMEGMLGHILERKVTVNFFIAYRGGNYVDPFVKEKFPDLIDVALMPEDYPDNVPPEILDGTIDSVIPLPYTVWGRNDHPYEPKIYLLVDRYVYSSSEAFAAFVKAAGLATIVGEQTGGDGIGFDSIPIVLPNSLLAIRIPADMGLAPDGSPNEELRTTPDIQTSWNIEDWRKRCDYLHNTFRNGLFNPRVLLEEYDPDIQVVLEDLGY
jgi:Peptidase family S41